MAVAIAAATGKQFSAEDAAGPPGQGGAAEGQLGEEGSGSDDTDALDSASDAGHSDEEAQPAGQQGPGEPAQGSVAQPTAAGQASDPGPLPQNGAGEPHQQGHDGSAATGPLRPAGQGGPGDGPGVEAEAEERGPAAAAARQREREEVAALLAEEHVVELAEEEKEKLTVRACLGGRVGACMGLTCDLPCCAAGARLPDGLPPA
jgi:hypothetical protein